MKKEWIVQGIALLLHYVDTIKEVSHEGVHFSADPEIDFIFLLYHLSLFLIVNYILIPQFFYKKKFFQFFFYLFGLLILYGIVEEAIVEQILDPTGRGNNALTWQSVYYFIQENLVPLLAFMSIKFVFDSFEQQRKLEQIERDSLTNELKFLKSQIQPHILFNSLNSLYDYTLSNSNKAPQLVLQLSNVLRYVLYDTSTAVVPLEKEINFIEDYIALQKMQLEGRGDIHFFANNHSTKTDLKIAPFLLIPFIENSFKHSLKSIERGIRITIKIDIQDDAIHLMVENNFENIVSTSEDLLTKGIGLKNVQKRLELLYPKRHTLEVKQTDNLYKIALHVLLN